MFEDYLCNSCQKAFKWDKPGINVVCNNCGSDDVIIENGTNMIDVDFSVSIVFKNNKERGVILDKIKDMINGIDGAETRSVRKDHVSHIPF